MDRASEDALLPEEFDTAWKLSFEQIVKDAVTLDRLRARRLVVEGRVAQAALDTVAWTKWAVIVALTTSTLSLAVGVADLMLRD
jgi:hypothetical protein